MQGIHEDYKRRREERRKRIRRRRILIGFFVFLILSMITFAVLSLTVLFPVREITATGSKIYSAEQIIKAAGITTENNIFTFSAGNATDKLQKQLPFIEDVNIERNLPGTVSIKVTDAKEYVCYPVGGEYYTVSRKGRVLKKYSESPEGIFKIRCNSAVCELGEDISFSDEKTKNTVATMLDSFEAKGIKVDEIDITDPLNLNARVEGRFDVNFGTSGSLEKKIAHLSGMIKDIAPNRTGRINLSMWSVEKTEGTFKEMPID